MAEEKRVLLEMRGICKSFIGVNALKGVDLVVREGEVHALEGENGAGKSVLIKILTGIYQKDAGTIMFDGKEVNFNSPAQAQEAGIRPIYQELTICPMLSVAENMFMGNEIKKNGFIDWKETYKRAEEILQSFKLNIDVRQPMGNLSAAMQQMVAIAMAVSLDAKLIIMDEATSSLDDKEVQSLLNIVRELQRKNIAIIFITHRMNEIYEICERCTILKDGEFMGSYDLDKLPKLDLISKMVGRDASTIVNFKKRYNDAIEGNEVVCEFKNVSHGMRLKDINLQLKKGEVLGLAGLLGSGRTETGEALYGITKHNGTITVKGKEVNYSNIRQALKDNIVLCPEERKRDAIFPDMSIEDNITISILNKISKFGFIDRKKQAELVEKYIKLLKIKTPNKEQLIKFLSGGNQQKCIIARAMCCEPEIIVLDEPTRGIDVGAKLEIEMLIQDIAKDGISVIMISSILEELERDCDRVVIMREGVMVGELLREDITEANIIHTISEAHTN